jgi:hypothetical protein
MWNGDVKDSVLIVSTAVFTIINLCLAYRDSLVKSVVVLYDLENESQANFSSLYDAFNEMMKCSRKWHVHASGKVSDKKYNAGAEMVIRRDSIILSFRNPPFVKTNIPTPAIPVGNQTLYFFPDKVLVFDAKGVGAVSYDNLLVEISTTSCIETGSLPSDGKIVDYTWKYVNKNGGPDKRFKHNPRYPMLEYEEVNFTSESGLNEVILFSKRGVAQDFVNAIRQCVQSTDFV